MLSDSSDIKLAPTNLCNTSPNGHLMTSTINFLKVIIELGINLHFCHQVGSKIAIFLDK